MAQAGVEPLPVQHVADVEAVAELPWLVEGLWPAEAVGFLGGHPKTGKSWLALDIALSVASGTPALGCCRVETAGPVLVFAAEDSPVMVRARFEGIAAHRGVLLRDLPLHLVLADRLRLETQADQARLTTALRELRPALLILDPFVRMTGIDENSAQEVSRVLGFLRGLQRSLGLAILVVHHVRKSAAPGGLALRGSGDFWAWSDTNLFLARRKHGLELALEHRSSAAPEPMRLELVTDAEAGPFLRCAEGQTVDEDVEDRPLSERVLELVSKSGGPVRIQAIRDAVRARMQSVVDVLRDLEAEGRLQRDDDGWRAGEP